MHRTVAVRNTHANGRTLPVFAGGPPKLLVLAVLIWLTAHGQRVCGKDILVGDLKQVNHRDAALVAVGNGVYLRRQWWVRERTLDGRLLGEGNPYVVELLIAPQSLSDFDRARGMSRDQLVRDLTQEVAPQRKFPLDKMSWGALVCLFVHSRELARGRDPDDLRDEGWLVLVDNSNTAQMAYHETKPVVSPGEVPARKEQEEIESFSRYLCVRALRRGNPYSEVVDAWGSCEEEAYGEELRGLGFGEGRGKWTANPGMTMVSPRPPVSPEDRLPIGRADGASSLQIGETVFSALTRFAGGIGSNGFMDDHGFYWAPGIGLIYRMSTNVRFAVDAEAVNPPGVGVLVDCITEILVPDKGFYWRLGEPDSVILEMLGEWERAVFPDGTDLPGIDRRSADQREPEAGRDE